MLQLCELSFIFSLLLTLKLKNLSVCFFLHFTSLLFELAFKVPLEVLNFSIELRLNFSLLSFQALNITSFAFKLFVLLVFEFLELEFIALTLSFLDSFSLSFIDA